MSVLYSVESYSEPCQIPKMEGIAKIVSSFSQDVSSWVFDRVLNTPVLFIKIQIH